MSKYRKRLYTVKPGFQLVKDNPSADYDDKFQDFLLYIWEYIPSGVMRSFKIWLVDVLQEVGTDVDVGDIDNALSSGFRRFEIARSKKRLCRRRKL